MKTNFTKALISPLAIAPMIDWTYTHFRVFMRLIAPYALLYTEMQTIGAIMHNRQRALLYHPLEHPLALQLGGADQQALTECAKIAQDSGFAEINLNLGCPSDRVQAGRFGACMMKEPALVADCIAAMKDAVSIPVTAKTRIGLDHDDSYEFFANFARQLALAGCDKLIVHARKAWLKGLNPHQNRTIPPVHYDYAYRIKEELTDIPVVINGNISQINDIMTHLKHVDGVMLGRLACDNPYALAAIHRTLYSCEPIRRRSEIFTDYLYYIEQQFQQNVPLSLLLKPALNLAHGLAGSKKWKHMLTEAQQSKQIQPLKKALVLLQECESFNDIFNSTPRALIEQ